MVSVLFFRWYVERPRNHDESLEKLRHLLEHLQELLIEVALQQTSFELAADGLLACQKSVKICHNHQILKKKQSYDQAKYPLASPASSPASQRCHPSSLLTC